MKPEDEALIRELALSLLNQRPAGEAAPQEIVITYRKHEDYENFIRRIAELELQLKEAQYQAARLSLYAEENFVLYDQLRQAYKDLSRAGMDVSYITSVRRKQLR